MAPRLLTTLGLTEKLAIQKRSNMGTQEAMPELITHHGSCREEISLAEAFDILQHLPHEYFRNSSSLAQWGSCPTSALIRLTDKDVEEGLKPVAGYYRLTSSRKAKTILNRIRTNSSF
jgi:hypothetical protein